MKMFGIYWAGMDKLIFLPIFLLFIYFIIKNYVRIKSALRILIHPKTSKFTFKNFSIRKQLLKTICLVGALSLMFIALLQPQWNKKEQKVIQEGRDLLIALDISRSMLAEDLKPNRLEYAKLKIRSLLSKLSFERVGLVLFSGTAFLQSPLTADHSAFLMFLNQVDTETISSGTTAIDKALTKSLEVYEKSGERKNKLVLLITDGEDFSLNLAAVKKKAKDLNVKLFALGMATPEGAPIPKFDRRGNQIGHERDDNGKVAISALNEQLLKDTCSELEGHYFKARYDDAELQQLANLIKRFEKEQFADKKISRFEDQYSWFLGAAWLLLLLEWVL